MTVPLRSLADGHKKLDAFRVLREHYRATEFRLEGGQLFRDVFCNVYDALEATVREAEQALRIQDQNIQRGQVLLSMAEIKVMELQQKLEEHS